MVAAIFCTETSHYVNYNVSNQHWTSSSNLHNESNAQNKFAFKCWSFQAFNVLHQLPSFFALCFAIFADELVLLIFVLQTFSWNHSRIYFFAPFFFRLKHFEASGLVCVVKGILLDIGLNLWHSLVLQSQISNFPYSLKRSVSCVKLISLKNFTLSLNEAPKAHNFVFCYSFNVLLCNKNQIRLLCQTPKLFLLWKSRCACNCYAYCFTIIF